MRLFSRKETDEQRLKRLSKNAGNVLEMFKAYFNTTRGIRCGFKVLIFLSPRFFISVGSVERSNRELNA